MSQFFRTSKVIWIWGRAKRVSRLDFRAVVADATGRVRLTDLMLQEGREASGHVPATREMLRKLREDAVPAMPKHFNAVVRGRRVIIVPNRGRYWSIVPDAPVVTTPIDFTIFAKDAVPAEMSLSHHYRTRWFVYNNPLNAGDVFEFLASKRCVTHNGIPAGNYTGLFHQCAAGNSRFNIDLVQAGTARPHPSARVLVEIQEWELGSGGRRL